MIPIKDDNPRVLFPAVTLFLIIANAAVFVYQYYMGTDARIFLYKFGAIPMEIAHPGNRAAIPDAYRFGMFPALSLFSSMFLHGGIVHLAGNMLYLWIFGDNVEGIMGHARFLCFYLLCGLIAGSSHVLLNSESVIPMIGASGAVSGVLGAYAVRFPTARVYILIFLFIFIRIITIPAVVVLGIWFLIQILSNALERSAGGGGVAWSAHIGGFTAGLIFVFLFQKNELVRRARRRLRQ